MAGYSTRHRTKQEILSSSFVPHDWILQHQGKYKLLLKFLTELGTSALSSSLHQLFALQALLEKSSLQ